MTFQKLKILDIFSRVTQRVVKLRPLFENNVKNQTNLKRPINLVFRQGISLHVMSDDQSGLITFCYVEFLQPEHAH